MTISPKVKEFLDKEQVKYEVAEHPLAYTATEVAGVQHVPGKKMVKSVIVKSGKDFIMCVLPAIHLVDFSKLKKALNTKDVQLADEEEIANLFPDYDVGAEPPFGQLYGLKVVADSSLDEDQEIVFNAGTHTAVVKMTFADFKKIVQPSLANIGSHI